MRRVYSPHVCLFMGVCLVPGSIRIVTELLHGTLEKKLKEDVHPLSERLRWAKEAAQGVCWLHGNDPPLIHRDLKLSNLLMDASGKVKVCDFGLSEFREDQQISTNTKPIGTPLYMAPEVMQRGEITEKVDVYSFGILLWEILCRKPAFSHHKQYDAFSKAICQGERPPIPEGTLPELAQLMTQCWAHEAKLRPSFEEVVAKLEGLCDQQKVKERNELINTHVSDPDGANLWRHNFLHEDQTEFHKFIAVLFNHFALPVPRLDEGESLNNLGASASSDMSGVSGYVSGYVSGGATKLTDELRVYHALHIMLAYDNRQDRDIVTLEQWGRFLGWFGPLNDGALFHRVLELCSCDWFHGQMESKIAENLLRILPLGYFLVRFSNNRPNCFCISKVAERENKSKYVHHIVVQHIPGAGFKLGNTRMYASMQELIQKNAAEWSLQSAAPHSRFRWLFSKETDRAEVAGYDDAVIAQWSSRNQDSDNMMDTV